MDAYCISVRPSLRKCSKMRQRCCFCCDQAAVLQAGKIMTEVLKIVLHFSFAAVRCAVDLYTGTVLEIKFCMLPLAKCWVCEPNVVKHLDLMHQCVHAGKPRCFCMVLLLIFLNQHFICGVFLCAYIITVCVNIFSSTLSPRVCSYY